MLEDQNLGHQKGTDLQGLNSISHASASFFSCGFYMMTMAPWGLYTPFSKTQGERT